MSTLFADLSDVSDRLATFVEPLFIVGGLSVHLEQTNYASVSQLVDLLADYGMAYHVPAQTHDLRGLLDVVASRDDLRPPSVDVIDVGLSAPSFTLASFQKTADTSLQHNRRQTVVSARRCGLPRDGLSSSLLCQPTAWHVYV